MARITNPYTNNCKSTNGGIKNLYLFDYTKYNYSEIEVSDMRLTTFPSSFIYLYKCNGSFTQSTNIEEGSISVGQTLSVQLPQVYDVLDLNKLVKGEYRAIVETYNGYYIMLGLRNGLTFKAENNSGSSLSEFSGFSLSFEGLEETYAPYILDLDSLGFTSDSEFNNYILQDDNNYILNG